MCIYGERQTDRQTNRENETEIERQTDRETETQRACSLLWLKEEGVSPSLSGLYLFFFRFV